ncbi:MAG: response regulator transcription factor [Lachnospiraceae bacterium]|nr:response regulator transcription factor [Lachnospiraceae bacterium]
MNQTKVMIFDDNPAVHESLSKYLTNENMIIKSFFDGTNALQEFEKFSPDILILDIMMPGMSGTDICREIRKNSNVPIIMLSARSEEFDRVLGLELGADDYVTKPFSPRELTVRIKNILRRVNPSQAANINNSVKTYLDLHVDTERYEVKVKNELIEATPKEVEILAYFIDHAEKVVSREQLINALWGYEYYGNTRAVDNQIKRIRKKIADINTEAEFTINSIYGVGYKLEKKEERIDK